MVPPRRTARPRARRRLCAALVVGLAALLCLPVPSLGDLHRELSSRQASAAQLRAAIAAETQRISATSAGVRQAQARLAALQGEVNATEAQFAAVQRQIVAARDRLTVLENRLHRA